MHIPQTEEGYIFYVRGPLVHVDHVRAVPTLGVAQDEAGPTAGGDDEEFNVPLGRTAGMTSLRCDRSAAYIDCTGPWRCHQSSLSVIAAVAVAARHGGRVIIVVLGGATILL
jgi:hypothetical protein